MVLNIIHNFYKLNKQKRFFFDFFTNWNIYLFIFCNFFYYKSNLMLVSRTGVIICSTIGSFIIVLRGKSISPNITKYIYTYGFDIDFNLKNILIIDILAHGIPLYFVLVSGPIENFEFSYLNMIFQYCIFCLCFVIFQKLRNISIDKTYNLSKLRTDKNKMMFCILIYFICLLPISINPKIIHSSWSALGIQQYISSIIIILLYYYFIYIFKE